MKWLSVKIRRCTQDQNCIVLEYEGHQYHIMKDDIRELRRLIGLRGKEK